MRAMRKTCSAPAMLVLAAALLSSGCDLLPPTRPDRATTAAATAAVQTTELTRAGSSLVPPSLAETAAPVWSFREYELPAGCAVTDNTDTLVAYEQSTWQPYPTSTIGLLDLETGRSHVVLGHPVGAARHFDAFTPMLSDSWLVWEEVSPQESASPRDAEWRLYAAPVERTALRVGEPLLVDEGATDYKLRPHYGVERSTVYWSVTTVPSSHQEHVPRSGRIEALDLETGERSTLYRSQNPLLSLRVSGGHAVVVEDARAEWAAGRSLDAGSVASRSPESRRHDRVVVLDAASRVEVLRWDLPSSGPPAHFADYAEGYLAWSAFPRGGGEWPDLHVRSPVGEVALAGANGIDPVTAGRVLAFESVAATRRAGGTLDRRRQIWCVDLAQPHERFRLLDTATAEEGWWQTTRASRTRGALVLWNDLGPWMPDPRRARTLVRDYQVPLGD